MFVIFDPAKDLGAELVRFDYMTMTEEWVNFLETQCGYEKADMALVAALSFVHAALFVTGLEENSIKWNDLDGTFGVQDQVVLAYGGCPLTREELDEVWSNAFDYTNEQFDEIEQRIADERGHGIV